MIIAYRYVKKKRAEGRKDQGEQPLPTQESNARTSQLGDGGRNSTAIELSATGTPSAQSAGSSAPTKNADSQPSPAEIAEKKRRRTYRWKIILGLFAPFALQALDTTIIASALPYIANDFGEVQQLNWIISAFNLTSAAFLLVWAQLADIFGRHTTIQAALVVMLVGSAICTGAPTNAFGVLLLGRAIQGIGVAGVNIGVRVILADRVSLTEYAVNWTIFIIISGVSFGVGPVIGGYLTHASWRWCFAINLPVAVLAVVLVLFLLRKELLGAQPLSELGEQEHDLGTHRGRLKARLSTIDYGGQVLFLFGLGLLSLALTWAGGSYPWGSVQVLVPLILGILVTIAWIIYEYGMTPGHFMARILPHQRPMMPWELISQRDVSLLFLINFTIGVSMFAVMYFMDVYFALVEQESSSDAGLALLYYLPGLALGSYSAMFAANVWPRQTVPPLMLGGVASAVGMTVLAVGIHLGNTVLIYVMMAIVGFGVGLRLNPASIHGLAYFPEATAQITCIQSFALPFGGLVGLTIMSTVFTNKSGPSLDEGRDGVMWAFIAMVPFMWLCVICTTFLGNTWILKDGGHEVVNGAYLWSLVTGKQLTRERKTRGEEHNLIASTDKEKLASRDEEAVAGSTEAPAQVYSDQKVAASSPTRMV